MKKLAEFLLSAALLSTLAGCSSGNSSQDASKPEQKSEYTVAVVKQLDHASLDEIANAVIAELDALAAKNNIRIVYEEFSGQNDQTTLKQIGDQVIAEGVDAIIPIATLAAQTMTVAAEETKTPVIFAAVSDPEGSDLTGFDYVTGTSDALNTTQIMDMMFAQNADIKKVGLLYSTSESNSEKPVADAKKYIDGMPEAEYIEATGNTRDEIITAASVLIAEGVDAIFTPTDNVVMDAEISIKDALIEAGIPHYTGADSFVRNGAFTTCGVNYTDLGTKTADLAYEALTKGIASMEDFYLMDGGIITVNTETAEALGADTSMFSKFGEVVEVTTTEE
ncbi:MAG: ABC transporter substrate-binding protein [Solobacterium sp.]|nr:ABC transporter substrate-binding protein [Solobacterium sp.]